MQISTKLCILVENVIPLFYFMIEKMNLSYHVLSMEKLFSSLQTLNSTQQWSEKEEIATLEMQN